MTPQEMRRIFAETIFPPSLFVTGGEIEVRVLYPERVKDGKESRPVVEYVRWFNSVDQLTQWALPSDRHVWIGAATRSERQGKKANCVATSSLWVDIDKGGYDALSNVLSVLQDLELPPTFIIESSPAKFHLWWRLIEPIDLTNTEQREKFEDVLRSMVKRFKTDPNCVDCSRVMRLPGSWNVKPKYGPNSPTSIIKHHDLDPAYPLASFVKAFSTARTLPPTLALSSNGTTNSEIREKPSLSRASDVSAQWTPGLANQASAPPSSSSLREAFPYSDRLPHLGECYFIQHSWINARSLPEPLWSALGWTFLQFGEEGERLFEAFSSPHEDFDLENTRSKISYAKKHNYHPPTCRFIGDQGFPCPKMDPETGICTLAPVRKPAALIQIGPIGPGGIVLRAGRTWRLDAEGKPINIADFILDFTEEERYSSEFTVLKARVITPVGREYQISIPGAALADGRDLCRRLAMVMGSDFRYLNIRFIASATATWLTTSEGNMRRIQISQDFGFTKDGRDFMGISDEQESSVRLQFQTQAAQHLGLRSISPDQLDRALRFLLGRWPQVACGAFAAKSMIAAAMWAIIAPVMEAKDHSISTLCVWLAGPSGVGKTTAGLVAQCFFGNFASKAHLVSFGSTALSLESIAHEFRGALLAIDDAKASALLSVQRQNMIGVLQRLHDRTARQRLRSDSTAMPALGSRATIIVNGEDMLFDEASIRARYFSITAERPLIENSDAIRELHEVLPFLHGVSHAFVQELMQKEDWALEIHTWYVEALHSLMKILGSGDNRPRVAASAAALDTGWQVFLWLAQEKGILNQADRTKMYSDFWEKLVTAASEQIHRTNDLTPSQRFLEDLRTLIQTRQLFIDGLGEEPPRAIRVGFLRDDWVCVFPSKAVNEINGLLHRDGELLPRAESIGYSLNSMHALAQSNTGRASLRLVDPMNKQKVTVWAIKKSVFENDD